MAKEIRTTTDDGITHVRKAMSQSTRMLPTFGQWRWLMEQRPEHGFLMDGCDDEVWFACVGCGLPTKRMAMSLIHVGALVRMEVEEQTGTQEWTTETKVKPVQHRGLGCSACAQLYAEEQAKVNSLNESEEAVYALRSAIWQKVGGDRPQPPRKFTAWLDLGPTLTEQRDIYMQSLDRKREAGLLDRPRPPKVSKGSKFDPSVNDHGGKHCERHGLRLPANGRCTFCAMLG